MDVQKKGRSRKKFVANSYQNCSDNCLGKLCAQVVPFFRFLHELYSRKTVHSYEMKTVAWQ
jgi:hypothetical protein